MQARSGVLRAIFGLSMEPGCPLAHVVEDLIVSEDERYLQENYRQGRNFEETPGSTAPTR